MKTVELKLKAFTIDELKEVNPESYYELYDKFQYQQEENYYGEDIQKSFFEIIDALPITYRISNSGDSFSKLEFEWDQIAEFTGKRAFAWLENNLLYKLRITRKTYLNKRKQYFKYGTSYRIGCIEPCPFTGVTYDECFLYSLQESIKSGKTLEDSIHSLIDLYFELQREDLEFLKSEEFFIDSNDRTYNEEGMDITDLINRKN